MNTKKYYILYETSNLINGKKYIGVHSTNNLNDGYLGSGKLLLKAIKKYGIFNFSRKIISFFANKNDMYKTEEEYVNKEFVERTDTYNLMEGGLGGNGEGEKNTFYGKRHSEETKKRIGIKSSQRMKGSNNPNYGRVFSAEERRKIGLASSQRNKGSNNPMYGTSRPSPMLGKKHTEESKNKMKEAHRKNKYNKLH